MKSALCSPFLHRVAVLSAVASLPSAVHAEDELLEAAEVVTLDQMIDIGMHNNYGVAMSTVGRELAYQHIDENKGLYDLNLSASLLGERSVQNFGLGEFDLYTGNVSVQQQLPWSASVTAGFQTRWEQFYYAFAGPYYQSKLGLTYSQHLLQGLGIDVTNAGIDKAKIDFEFADTKQKETAAGIVASICGAYWDLFFLSEGVRISANALELAQEQLRETRELIQVGRLPEVEALAVERVVAQRQEGLVVARTQLKQRSVFVRRGIGLRPITDRPLTTAQPIPQSLPSLPQREAFVAQVKELSPALAAADLSRQFAAIDLKVARSMALPKLDLRVFTSVIGYLDNTFGSVPGFTGPSDRLDGFARSLGQMFGANASIGDTIGEVGVGLDFAYPLQNRAAKKKYDLAKLKATRAQLSWEDTARGLELHVRQTFNDLESAAERVELTKAATRFAKRALEEEVARFRVGRSTNFVVLEKQDDLLEARFNELKPIVEYMKALALLQAMDASILEVYGVNLEELTVENFVNRAVPGFRDTPPLDRSDAYGVEPEDREEPAPEPARRRRPR